MRTFCVVEAPPLFNERRRGKALADYSGFEAAKLPAYSTYDLSAEAAVGARATLVFSVENLADKAPPISLRRDIGWVYAEHYDIVGRRFAISMKAAF